MSSSITISAQALHGFLDEVLSPYSDLAPAPKTGFLAIVAT
jgi:hypothetical protein